MAGTIDFEHCSISPVYHLAELKQRAGFPPAEIVAQNRGQPFSRIFTVRRPDDRLLSNGIYIAYQRKRSVI